MATLGTETFVRLFCTSLLITIGIGPLLSPANSAPVPLSDTPAVQRLAGEVRHLGWICFAARSDRGDWDLFLCRPDGSAVRNLTRTPEYNEFSPQFSRDDRRLLYRRLPRAERIDDNRHGAQGELVIANSDASSPRILGAPGELPWASWSPDGNQIACLALKGIFFFDIAAGKEVRRLERKGFFQQLTWSPDGEWLAGVANSFGAGWSVARLNVVTGQATAIHRVDCCTPDWSPDSQRVIFSWRPPGQKANNGYGWTQLWLADAEGRSRQLVYGEDGRHVYGGHVSPDGRYALFTGNIREDGDPGNAGSPMALIRLSDAPIIGGPSEELRALHPQTKSGPVLALPDGWEPCWTFADAGGAGSIGTGGKTEAEAPMSNQVEQLALELRPKGWLVFSSKTERGDWDLFLMRPDGSDRRPLTQTTDFNEAGARFSPDGSRLLYYRMPKSEPVDNNTYGTFDLVVAHPDGAGPVVFGNQFQWASWGPDGKQLACLGPKGIRIVDLATRQVVRQFARNGLVSQLVWSPDGRRFVGTANGLGPFWNIGCLTAETGEFKALSETDRFNCTPDWVPDGREVVFARGIIPEQGGRAELWAASATAPQPQAVYAETGRHIYGACASPDGAYLLFTRSVEDLGKVDHTGTTMSIIRRSDAPMAGDPDSGLRQRLPQARSGPRLDLGPGWEPHWTAAAVSPAN